MSPLGQAQPTVVTFDSRVVPGQRDANRPVLYAIGVSQVNPPVYLAEQAPEYNRVPLAGRVKGVPERRAPTPPTAAFSQKLPPEVARRAKPERQ